MTGGTSASSSPARPPPPPNPPGPRPPCCSSGLPAAAAAASARTSAAMTPVTTSVPGSSFAAEELGVRAVRDAEAQVHRLQLFVLGEPHASRGDRRQRSEQGVNRRGGRRRRAAFAVAGRLPSRLGRDAPSRSARGVLTPRSFMRAMNCFCSSGDMLSAARACAPGDRRRRRRRRRRIRRRASPKPRRPRAAAHRRCVRRHAACERTAPPPSPPTAFGCVRRRGGRGLAPPAGV